MCNHDCLCVHIIANLIMYIPAVTPDSITLGSSPNIVGIWCSWAPEVACLPAPTSALTLFLQSKLTRPSPLSHGIVVLMQHLLDCLDFPGTFDLRLSVEIICCDQLLRFPVVISCWDSVAISCWDYLLCSAVEIICWDQLLILSVEIICCDQLLRLSVMINCWDYMLRSIVEILC